MNYDATIIPGGSFTWHEYAFLHDWNVLAHPSEIQEQNAITLFSHLQDIRNLIKKPIIIRSGARTPEYTAYLRKRGVPAALHSPHMEWKAVDITIPSMSNKDLWLFCNDNWKGRLENLHFTPTWVHLDVLQWGERVRFNP